MKTYKLITSFALLSVLAMTLFASCKKAPEEQVTDPQENYDNNHRKVATDTTVNTTDTIINNSTQTDPAATK